MSAEWVELFAPLGDERLNFFLNDREELSKDFFETQDSGNFFIAIATEFDQFKAKHAIIRAKQMYLENFFKWDRVSERFYGICQPVNNVCDAVLSVVYTTSLSFKSGMYRYFLRHLRHILVDVTSLVALPILLSYDILINKMYGGLIKDEPWSVDNFISGVIYLMLDICAALIILPSELFRHVLSFVISIISLVPGLFVFYPIGYCLSVLFNDSSPFDEYSQEKKSSLLKEVSLDLIEMANEVLRVNKTEDILRAIDEMAELSKDDLAGQGLDRLKRFVKDAGPEWSENGKVSEQVQLLDDQESLVEHLDQLVIHLLGSDDSTKQKYKGLMFERESNKESLNGQTPSFFG